MGGAEPKATAVEVKDAQPPAAAKDAEGVFKGCFGGGKKKGPDNRALRKELPIFQHMLTLDELAAEYNVSYKDGLTSSQVVEQRAKFGENRLTPPNVKPAWRLYLEQYTNFFSILLLAGSVACFVAYGIDQSDASNLYLGVVLFVVVFLSSTFAYVQEAKSNAIMLGFKSMVPKKCKVVRGGTTAILDATELVPGDLVEFQEGDQVPADLRIIDAYNLKVDNSSLTGESEACERVPELIHHDLHTGEAAADAPSGPAAGKRKVPAIEASNLVFYSTILTSGHGRGIVIGTGDNTVMGQIAGLAGTSSADQEPPISREVNRFITFISIMAVTLGAAFLGTGIGMGVMTAVQGLVFCISTVVAVVPEGLLVTLTVALAMTAKRMSNKNVLVKNLQGVETLGCTTVIASDKTGTLTQNRMTVQHCWYDGELHDVPAPKNLTEFEELVKPELRGPQGWSVYDRNKPSLAALQRVATLCNNSEFMVVDALDPSAVPLDLKACLQDKEFNMLGLQCTGDASESGLIKWVQLLKDVKDYRAEYPKLFEIKFNSTNKWQLGIHDMTKDGDSAPGLFMKGAPEKVWARCSHIMNNGKAEPITEEWNRNFLASYESLGALGERVLGFAFSRLEGVPHNHPWTDQPAANFPTDGLTFVGLASLMDPPRNGVPEAVAKCKRASVRVFMVTGDHPITAEAIAKQVGILDEGAVAAGYGKVVTGDDLRVIEDIEDEPKRMAAWDAVLKFKQIVFARVTPAHKLLIVENNQRHLQVVAVTGDGVNDAPALKKADIGISMGISGKDVSKEAADMILMDDNFASIVNGVEEGRLIFDNLKKSITYTLTSKLPELSPFLLWIAAQMPLATSTILILCIDLGTDMIPSISFAYEEKEADIMARRPRVAHIDHLVNFKLLWFSYLHIGVMQALAGWYAYCVCLNDYGYPSRLLMGLGLRWGYESLMCSIRGSGAPEDCGYGCAEYKNQGGQIAGLQSIYGNLSSQLAGTNDFCKYGCLLPEAYTEFYNNTRADPFSEFAPGGSFRGFAAGTNAVCGRTCGWYNSLSEQTKLDWISAASDPSSDLRYMLTPTDDAAFRSYCALPGAEYFGFPGRDEADSDARAPTGAVWWWAAAGQTVPNQSYQADALSRAQTAYFVAVVMNKIAAALICKTRNLSLLQQGITKNRMMLFGFCTMVVICVALSYIPPLNTVFSTGPLYGLHWLMGIPWFVLCIVYDESRKWWCRRFKGGLIDRITTW